MRSFALLGVGSVVVFAILAACVGDDPGSSSSSSSSTSGGSSSGTASSSGTGGSSGTSGGACAGDTVDACGASCTKCTAPTGGTVACTNGNCVPNCDAPLTLCTDKCIATKTTAENCGKCGHSCNGGTCTDGVCQPIQIAAATTSMLWFDVGAGGVVMSMDDTKVRLCDVPTGCSDVQLKSIASGLTYNKHVAVSGSTVFFDGQTGDPYVVYKCPIGGCPGAGPTVVETVTNDSIGTIVAGPTDLVWTRYDSDYGPYANKCVLPDCVTPVTARPVGTTYGYSSLGSRELDTPNHIASVGALSLVWATGGTYATGLPQLRSCPLSTTTCTPTDIPGSGAQALKYHDGKHYAAGGAQNGDVIFTIADAVGTTTRTEIINDDDGISDIAVDASGIYWVNSTTGQVRRCATLAGCSAAQIETLAVGQTGATQIRLDAGNVYWKTDTKVLRVVKP